MQMKLTLSASIVLYKIIVKILFMEDGKERDLPFNIRYKLQRCLEMLEKDAVYYEQHRVELVKKFGETLEDGTIKVPETKNEEFTKEAQTLLATNVEHDFIKLMPEEVLKINTEGVGHDEMALFIAAMIDDPELTADINKPIDEEVNNGEAANTIEDKELANE